LRKTFYFVDHCYQTQQDFKENFVFGLLDDFFIENEIPWTNCIDVCTDDARAMTGATAGAVAKIKEKSKETTSSHCIHHRHALAMKKYLIV